MTCIFALSFIIHLYTACAPLVASRNTIYLGVLLLTVRTRHFPLSYEGVPKPAIEVVRHAYRMYYRHYNLFWADRTSFNIVLLLSLISPSPYLVSAQ
jgi:hypothetical protein